MADHLDEGVPDPAASGSWLARRQRGHRWLRWELYAFLELAAVCGIVVAQPVLDVIGRSPDFLLFYGADGAEALLLAAVVVVVPPVALWALGAAARLAGARARRIAHAVSIGAACAAFAVQIAKHTLPVRGMPLAVIATLLGIAAAFGYARITVVGRALRVAAAGPVVFVLLFAFASPASAVVLGGKNGGAGAVAAPGREVGGHPSIVMIVFDELPLTSLLDPTGKIDTARTPNFAALAAGSTWYRNATAVSPNTTFAVPSMLTGRYPGGEWAPHYSRYPDNLFTLLGDSYDVQAWETVTQLCPPRYCRADRGAGLPTLLRESASLLREISSPYDSTEDPTAGFQEQTVAEEIRGHDKSPSAGPDFRMSRLADNQPARFTDFLAALAAAPGRTAREPAAMPGAGGSVSGSARPSAGVDGSVSGSARPSAGAGVPGKDASETTDAHRGDGGRPELHFLHLLIPHSPWLYLSSGTRYDGPGDLPYDGQWWARLAYQRHLQQVAYTDKLLGQVLHTLRQTGRYDQSLIVVTADHGDSFSAGVSGRDMDAAQRAAAELAWVPLFIKTPGQRAGAVDDRNWQHVDLLPTLADYAGFQPSWTVDGISAPRERRDGGDKRFDQTPGTAMTVRTATHFPAVLRGPAARPVLPDMAELELVGRAVTEFPMSDDGPAVTVHNGEEFLAVRPASGRLPALVDATLAEGGGRPPAGAPFAIAVNGRVGAVALAASDHDGDLRVVGLITDERLFTTGVNRLEFYRVAGGAGGWSLHRCAVG